MTLVAPSIPFIVALVLKSALLLFTGLIMARLAPRGAVRHAVYLATTFIVIGLPVLMVLLPQWRASLPSQLSSAFPALEQGAALLVPLPSAQHPLADRVRSVAAPLPGADAKLSTETLIMMAWLAGFLIVLVSPVRAQIRVQRIANAGLDPGPAVRAVFQAVRQRTGINIPARLVASEALDVPVALGVFRPTIVLPADFAAWPVARQHTVLTHELVHIGRRDCLLEYTSWLLTALYWFNPLSMLVARGLRTERENACDDVVVALGTPRCTYAEHLVEVAELARERWLGTGAVGFVPARRGLERRVLNVLHVGRRTVMTPMRLAAVATATVPFAIFTATVAPVTQQSNNSLAPLRDSLAVLILPGADVVRDVALRAGDTLTVRTGMGDVSVESGATERGTITAQRMTGPRGHHDTRVAIVTQGHRTMVCTVYTTATTPCEVSGNEGRGSVDDNFVSYRVRVPNGVHVRVRTGLGDVYVRATTSVVDAHSGNGNVDVVSSGATDIVAYTGRATYRRIAGGTGDATIRVLHGSIDLIIDEPGGAALVARADTGAVTTTGSWVSTGAREPQRFSGRVGDGRVRVSAHVQNGFITAATTTSR